MTETKPTNPKDAIGIMKVPLHLVSGVVKAYQAIAHYLGNVKYGAWNYRAGGARASVYYSALNRHVDRWYEGEKYDSDGTPHLANAQACLNVLIECEYGGNLVDDRPPSRDLNPLYRELEEIMVKIKDKYGHMDPRHYTIADTQAAVPPSHQLIEWAGGVTQESVDTVTAYRDQNACDRAFQERLARMEMGAPSDG